MSECSSCSSLPLLISDVLKIINVPIRIKIAYNSGKMAKVEVHG